jgi:FecR protein
MSHDPLDDRVRDWASSRSGAASGAAESRRLAEIVAGRAKERSRARRRLVVVVSAAALVVLGLTLVFHGQRQRAPETWTPEVLYLEGSATDSVTDTLSVPGEGRLVARIGADVVGLGEESTVRIEQARGTVTRLTLDAGTLVADVQPRVEPGGCFEVVAGPNVISVLGTRFLVEHRADEGLRVVVRDGVVRVSGPGGETRVEAGYRLDIDEHGQVTLEPVEPSIERLSKLLSAVPESIIGAAPPPTSGGGGLPGSPPPPPQKTYRGESGPPPDEQPPTLEELRQRLLDGDLEGTLADLDARLAEDPDDADAWALLAAARRKAGDRDAAIDAWREVVARGDGAAANRARYEASLQLQQLPGGHPEAIGLLEDLLVSPEGVEPLVAEARLHLAESLIAVGRQEEAWPMLEEVTRSFPGTGPALSARELLGDQEYRETEP